MRWLQCHCRDGPAPVPASEPVAPRISVSSGELSGLDHSRLVRSAFARCGPAAAEYACCTQFLEDEGEYLLAAGCTRGSWLSALGFRCVLQVAVQETGIVS